MRCCSPEMFWNFWTHLNCAGRWGTFEANGNYYISPTARKNVWWYDCDIRDCGRTWGSKCLWVLYVSMFSLVSIEPIRNTEIWILSAILDDLLHMYRVLVATGLLSRDACSCCTALTIGFFKWQRECLMFDALECPSCATFLALARHSTWSFFLMCIHY